MKTHSLIFLSVLLLLGTASTGKAQNSTVSINGLAYSFPLSMDESGKGNQLYAVCSFNITSIDTVNTVTIGIGNTAIAIDQENNVFQMVKQKNKCYLVSNGEKRLVQNGTVTLMMPVAGTHQSDYTGKFIIVTATDKKGNTSPLQALIIK